jgi:hypothetical protein
MANEFKIKKGLIVNGSGSTILDIQGSQGQLFSVTDNLSGSLFSVNDISGLPILQVSSDDSVKLGTFNAEAIKVQGSTAIITGSLFGTSSWAVSASWAPVPALATTASYAVTSSFLNGGTNGFIQNGNSFGTTATLGTNDNQSLAFETNGTTRMFISSSGNVGIGTTSPNTLGFGKALTISDSGSPALELSLGTTSTFDLVATYDASYISTRTSIPLIFQTNGSEKLRITSAGNVGIGTTSPSTKLDVYNSSFVGQLISTTSNYNAGIVFNNTNGAVDNRNWAIYTDGYTYGDLHFVQSNAVGGSPVSAGTSRMVISLGGNVGIGTTSPYAKLTINDGTNINLGIKYGQTDATAIMLNAYNDAVDANIPLEFRASKYNFTNGNVGIGTTTPNSKLEVSGNIFSNYSTTGSITLGNNAANANPYGGITAKGNPDGTFTGNLSFFTSTHGGGTDYGLTEQMYIRTVGYDSKAANIVMLPYGGNLGIGTTSPKSTLQLGSNYPTLLNFDTNNGSYLGSNFYYSSGWKRVIGSNATAISFKDGITSFQTSGWGAADSAITWTDTVTIDTGGYVGIGTTSPNAKLDVNGNTIITGSLTVTNGITGSLFGTASFALTSSFLNGGTNGFIQGGNSFGTTATLGTNDNNSLQLETSGSTRMFISSSGNVGIGTTSPTEKLQISNVVNGAAANLSLEGWSNSSRAIKIITNTGTPSLRWTIGATDAGGEPGSQIGTDFEIHRYEGATSLGTGLFIKRSTGNVGIGTTSPETRLMVYNTITSDPAIPGDATTGMFSLNKSGQATLSFGVNSSNTYWISNVNRAFAGNNYYNISLNPLGGNVGIGTTSPSTKLQVAGTITSTGALTAYTSVPSINIGHNGVSAFIASTSGNGANSPISFSVGNNAEKMRITVGGNVGIGTTSPGARLDVRAPGALSTDIAFKVRNSADTADLVTVNGLGVLTTSADASINGLKVGLGGGNVATNASIGVFTLGNNTTGGNQVGIGYASLTNLTSGNANTSIGSISGRYIADKTTSLTNTSNSVFLGYRTSPLANSQTNQIVIGYDATGIGSNSVVLGNDSIVTTALKGNIGIGTTDPGTYKLNVVGTAIITGKLTTNVDANINYLTVGRGSGDMPMNVAYGYKSLLGNTTGDSNTAIGSYTLGGNTTGINNTAIGADAVFSNTVGSYNTATGYQTLYSNTIGDNNTANGVQALYFNTEGNNNTANGYHALYLNTTGLNNTAIGTSALGNNTTGDYNLALGVNAGNTITTGNLNIIIGTDLDFNPDGTPFDGSHTLSIGKNSVDKTGYPHIWAPEASSCAPTDEVIILTLDYGVYSGILMDYCIVNEAGGNSRVGTYKATFRSNGGGIAESDTDSVSSGTTSEFVIKIDGGSGLIKITLRNNSTTDSATINHSSRLLLRG